MDNIFTEENAGRILVLEDDFLLQTLVRKALENAGFVVETAVHAEEAFQIIEKSGFPHLAIVDIMLPQGMNGLEFCGTIHEITDLPVIILSAITNSNVVIQAIEQHAEDYVKKPFDPSELVARVRRVLKRIGDFAYTLEPVTQIDERLRVDFHKQHILVEDKRISLTPTETKLLYILMRDAGKTVKTPFILRRMWPRERAFEDRLRVCIYRLRRKMGTNAADQLYIQSQRGVGYRFYAG